MSFGEKLHELRRKKGYSQEQLADLLSLSRQAISKWEAGSAMPEIEKLIAISDLFGVSVDYLIRDNTIEQEEKKTVEKAYDNAAILQELSEIKNNFNEKPLTNAYNAYEYKSKTKVFGLPLLHVNYKMRGAAVAKGIIAIGDVAIGAIALGGLAIGIISIGGISIGLLLAMGGIALGGFSFGGMAIGVYAMGGCALAIEIAAGGFASARIAIGGSAVGAFTLQEDEIESARHVWEFIKAHLRK